jgi:predicted hydrolase (HD superfamily)
MDLLPWARALSEQLLAEPLQRRWAHTQGVGALAEVIADVVSDDAEMLAAAAWLHDIGYSPELVKTGMHQLDGARYLRDVAGADPQLCSLVAHHTCAHIEARNRGLHEELEAEFPPTKSLLTDALTYCDMATTPDGELTSVADRLTEILSRYGIGSLVFETMTEATPSIHESVRRISALITAHQ